MATLELRPCIAGGKRAMFHRWVTNAFEIDCYGTIHGIVEYEDGSINVVKLESIRFIDGGGFDAVKWPDSAER